MKAEKGICKVNVKWGKQTFADVEFDKSLPLEVFQATLYSLTSVPPERQKIALKGKLLKSDSDLNAFPLADGVTLTLMGSTGPAIAAPTKPVVFLEDLSNTQMAKALDIPSGLVNLGNTCYMSATVQCLRAMPELRAALRLSSSSLEQDHQLNVVPALATLFKELGASTDGVSPIVFLNILRLAYPQFAERGGRSGGMMQQDAEECWVSIVSALREGLTGLNSDGKSLKGGTKFVDQYMTGLVQTLTVCDEAPDEKPTVGEDRFYKLAVNISAGITTYLTTEIGNSLLQKLEKTSETLQRTAQYTKSGKFKRLPMYLPVNFVRFQWKAAEQLRAKILKKVKFPLVLDLTAMCTDELVELMKPAKARLFEIESRESILRKLRPSESTGSAAVSKTHDEICKELNLSDSLANDIGANVSGVYDLVAVLTHAGRSADSGHYVAWVKQEGKGSTNWWKFDDDRVSPVEESEIEKLDGGGDWHSAYICLYKAKPLDLPHVDEQHLK